MSAYVKFMRGSLTDYNNLPTKDNDTFYFVSEAEANKGQLFLGEKQVVCENGGDIKTALAQLEDVKLPEVLIQDNILVYHIDEATGEEYWTAKDLSVFADGISVEANEGVFGLKNWGKQYYKYIAESDSYELQQVDESNPWIEGLEPRVAIVDGVLQLGWYQPNTTIVEGLSSQIASLQTTVGDIQEVNTTQNTAIDNLNAALAAEVARATGAEEANATAIASEKARLDAFLKLEDGETLNDALDSLKELQDFITSEAAAADELVKSVSDNTNAITQLNASLNDKVDKVDGKSLVADTEIEKLLGIEAGAEKNKINSVTEELSINEDRVLSIVSIDASKISNLSSNADIAALNSTVEELQTKVGTNITAIDKLNSDLASITTTVDTHTDDIAALKEAMTWKEI